MRSSNNLARKALIFSLTLFTGLLLSLPSHAFFGLFGGGIPVLEPLSTASETGKTISVTATEIVAMYDKVKQEIANTDTAALFKYVGKFDRKVESSPTPGTKRFAKLELNEDKTKKLVHKLFMQYPSNDVIVQLKYKEETQEFYDDTVLDVYSGVNELNKYLTVDVANKFAELKKVYDEGGDGAQKAEDMNAAAFNSYVAAHQTIDSIAEVVQEATALKAQLQAAKAMRDAVPPIVYGNTITCPAVADGDKVSYNTTPDLSAVGRAGGEAQLAFAQISTIDEEDDEAYLERLEKDDLNVANGEKVSVSKCLKIEQLIKVHEDLLAANPSTPVSDAEDDSADLSSPTWDISGKYDYKKDNYNEDKSMYDKDPYIPHDEQGMLTFERGEEPWLEHTMFEKRKYSNELDKLEELYDNVKLAINAHNLIRKIREAAQSFKDYDNLLKLHERAKKAVAISDQCGVNLMSLIYRDPGKVWCGSAKCAGIDDAGVRSGISGWAMETYETAKAANVTSIDKNDLTMPEPIPGLDPKNLNSVDSEKKDIESKLGILAGEQFADQGRKAELLPWQIGAAGIKAVSRGGWGSQYDNYRVWNDSRAFYTQFAELKYDNFYVFTRAETAAYIIREGMIGWNKANANNAKYDAEDAADEALKAAKEKAAEDDKFDLAGETLRIAADLASKFKDIDEEAAINDKFIPGINPTTDIAQRGEIVDESSCFMVFAAAEAAKAHIQHRTNPMPKLYSQGKGVLATADAYLLARIQALLRQLCTRGEAIYLYGGAGAMHAAMIADLIAYSIDIADRKGIVVYVVFPYRDFFLSHDVSQDTEYFVGELPQARDLKAPKEPAQMTYSPVREIFHYDNIDVDNSGGPSRQAFLNHGGEIPPIWRVLLETSNPFIEHKFDLKGILDGKYISGSTKDIELRQKVTLVRGGLHPCMSMNVSSSKIDDKDFSYFTAIPKAPIDLVQEDVGYFAGQIYNSVGLNPCIGMTQKGGYYHERVGSGFSLGNGLKVNALGRSELGMFMKADENNNISWRPEFRRLYSMVSALENSTNEVSIQDNYMRNVPLINNQLGTFIMIKDVEMQYRKAIEAMKEDMVELQAAILDDFKKLGLVAPENFDLAKDSDKDAATATLNSFKEARLKDISEQAKRVRIYILLYDNGNLCVPYSTDCSCTLNKPAKDRVIRYLQNRAALVQDNQELTTMSEYSKGGPELAEEIKMEEANMKLRDRYMKEADDAFKKSMQELTAPYCANYEEGAYTKGCGG